MQLIRQAAVVTADRSRTSTYNWLSRVPETTPQDQTVTTPTLADPCADEVVPVTLHGGPMRHTRRRIVYNDLGTILGLILGTYAAISVLLIVLVHSEKTLDQPREQPRSAPQLAPGGHVPTKPSTRELRAHQRRTHIGPGRNRIARHHTHGHVTR